MRETGVREGRMLNGSGSQLRLIQRLRWETDHHKGTASASETVYLVGGSALQNRSVRFDSMSRKGWLLERREGL